MYIYQFNSISRRWDVIEYIQELETYRVIRVFNDEIDAKEYILDCNYKYDRLVA